MAKKNFMDGLDRVISIHNEPGETTKEAAAEVSPKVEKKKAAAEVMPKAEKKEAAAEKKTGKTKAPKAQESGKTIVFSARVSPDVAEFIKDYAFTKRLNVGEALEKIIYEYKDKYEKNAKNEPILKKDR